MLLFFFVFSLEKTESKYMNGIYLLLQTYWVDQIGRTESRYKFQNVGARFRELNFDFTHIVSFDNLPLNFVNPIWLNFIDHEYHYIPLHNIRTNYSGYFEITPPVMHLPMTNMMTTQSFEFKILNIFDKPITIHELISFSKTILIPRMRNTVFLLPGKYYDFIGYTCPITPGYFRALLTIQTSIGAIPYIVTGRAVSSPRDTTIQPLYHQTPMNPSNFSLNLPPVYDSQHFSVIYDESMFLLERSSASNRFLMFIQFGLKPGYYVTFIHLLTRSIARTFPIILSVSKNFLQPYVPVILIEPVTSPNGTSEAFIHVTNPSVLTLHMDHLHLAPDAPSNLKIGYFRPPIDIQPFSDVVVGLVVLSGKIEGEVTTNVIITYETSVHIIQTLEIPVHGFVTYGEFVYKNETIVFYWPKQKSKTFKFRNNFKFPVAVFIAFVEHQNFKVIDFLPFIIQPGEESQDINIVLLYNERMLRTEATLTIDTNVTRISIPLQGYYDIMFPSDTQSLYSFKTVISHDFGSVYTGMTVKYPIYLTNQQTDKDLIITNMTTSSGINVRPVNILIPPMKTERVNLHITFQGGPNLNKTMADEGVRNDTITLFNNETYVTVVATWWPVRGSLHLEINMPDYFQFGKEYSTTIGVTSTFNEPIFLSDIKGNFNLEKLNYQLMPNERTQVAKISYIVDLPFLAKQYNYKIPKFEDIASPQIHFIVNFELKTGCYFSFSSPMALFKFDIDNMSLRYENAIVGIQTVQNVNMTNRFDIPIKYFILNDVPEMYFIQNVFVIKPHEEYSLPALFTPSSIGIFEASVKIVSDWTEPVFLKIWANVVPPQYIVRFSKDVYYVNTTDPLIVSLYVRNEEHINLTVENIRSNMNRLDDQPEYVVEPFQRALIKFVIDPYTLAEGANDFWAQVSVCRYSKLLRLNVILDPELKRKLRNRKKFIQFVLVLLTIIPHIFKYLKSKIRKKQMVDDYNDRMDNLKDGISRLSVSPRSSIGIQTICQQEYLAGGKWTKCTSATWHTTDEQLEQMMFFIQNFK